MRKEGAQGDGGKRKKKTHGIMEDVKDSEVRQLFGTLLYLRADVRKHEAHHVPKRHRAPDGEPRA